MSITALLEKQTCKRANFSHQTYKVFLFILLLNTYFEKFTISWTGFCENDIKSSEIREVRRVLTSSIKIKTKSIMEVKRFVRRKFVGKETLLEMNKLMFESSGICKAVRNCLHSVSISLSE